VGTRKNSGLRRERLSLLSRYSSDFGQCLSRERSEHALRGAAIEHALANRAKTEFLANMSHELRTPLNAIIGFSDLIGHPLTGEPMGSKTAEYAAMVNRAGRHLLAIVSDILDISKIESGTFTLDLQPHPLRDLIGTSAKLVEPRIKEKNQTLTVKLSPLLSTINADGLRMKQMLTNLLSNAHKFTPEGGQITVIAVPGADESIVITVQDTGIGMTPEQIAIALKPFGQVQSSYSRNHEGAGLGLPIAKALVEQHKGAFHIASQLGTGTAVILTFPKTDFVSNDSSKDRKSWAL
jgi:two-component system cell cycle sensor histidine kinase PleC